MGKRELGQLSIIDLIVSLLIAELATISIENYKGSILYSLIPIVILTLLQCILAYFSLKKPKFRIFLDGNPSVIIKNGDRKSTRLNSSHPNPSRMPSSA